MPWFKVDDGFHGHPKVVELSLSAVGLWTLTGSWCAKYLTDGFVPDKTVTRLGGTPDDATELVAADLWLGAPGGYAFKGWDEYQPLKSDVEAERAAAQERMKKVRAQKKGVRPNNDRTTGERSDEQPANVRDVFGGSSPDVRVTPSQSLSHPSPIPSPDETRGKKKPETRLPADWVPTASHYERAKNSGIDITAQAEMFRLHADTHDRHAANWNAAFTTWLTKAKPTKQGINPRDEWKYNR